MDKKYFNNKWINIEDVKIGDNNNYGTVVNITKHYATQNIKIKINKHETIATWNHPFLVKRKNNIYWVHADNLKDTDFILTMVSVYNTLKPINQKEDTCIKQKKDILGQKRGKMAGLGLNIILYGKNIMGRFLLVCKYIIKILTKQTIKLRTYNLLRPLNIKGITLVANLLRENGISRVNVAENIKNVIKNIGIIQEDGLTEDYVKNVIVKKLVKKERYVLQKVGSVKRIDKKMLVYNLSMSEVPAFETLVGVSHNTQKSLSILERFIEIFTDENEVVIDPVAGSGVTLLAAKNMNRRAYGFEIKKNFFKDANEKILTCGQNALFR